MFRKRVENREFSAEELTRVKDIGKRAVMIERMSGYENRWSLVKHIGVAAIAGAVLTKISNSNSIGEDSLYFGVPIAMNTALYVTNRRTRMKAVNNLLDLANEKTHLLYESLIKEDIASVRELHSKDIEGNYGSTVEEFVENHTPQAA